MGISKRVEDQNTLIHHGRCGMIHIDVPEERMIWYLNRMSENTSGKVNISGYALKKFRADEDGAEFISKMDILSMLLPYY